MRACTAAYVDVGYLLAAAATRVTGSSLRRGVQTEYPALIAALIAQIEGDSDLPLLRVNWYDAGSRPGGMPDAIQDEIGALPRVKLRLGRLSYSGEQKGVDVRIGLDLAIQAQHRVADVAYLVSGDDDLTEAVEEAQGRGVQVVLLAVADHDDRPLAVSKHLIRAADRVLLIDAETIDRTVKSMAIPEALLASLTSDVDESAEPAEASDAGPATTPGPDSADDATGPTDGETTGPTDGETTGSAADPNAADPTAADPTAADPTSGYPTAGVPSPAGADAPVAPRTRRRVRTHGGVPAAAGKEASAPNPTNAQPPGDPEPEGTEAPVRPASQATPVTSRQQAKPGATGVGTRSSGPARADADGPAPSPALLAQRKATELVLPGTSGTRLTPPDGSAAAPQPGKDRTAELIDDVAKRVVAAWCSSASPAALIELRERRPAIPAELDRALLVDLAGRGGGDDLDDSSRHAVRDRFWYHIARVQMT